jgi:hypothetical protein
MNPSSVVSTVTWLHSWWVSHRPSPAEAMSVTGSRPPNGSAGPGIVVADGGHDAVPSGPQAQPDRGAAVGQRTGDRLADRQDQVSCA